MCVNKQERVKWLVLVSVHVCMCGVCMCVLYKNKNWQSKANCSKRTSFQKLAMPVLAETPEIL